MHPVIARYLSPLATQRALQEPEAAGDLEARALKEAAQQHPGLKKTALGGKGHAAEQAAIALATHAAASLLPKDPRVAPSAHLAITALKAAGANGEETSGFLAEVLIDEAFAWDSEPGTFDVALVDETLVTLPALAALDNETVDDLMEAFAKGGAVGSQALRLKVIEALFEAAWGEGPAALNAEHVDAALEILESLTEASERPAVLEALAAALDLLHKAGLVGPLRLARLQNVVRTSATSPLADEEEDDEDEEKSLDEGGDEDEGSGAN